MIAAVINWSIQNRILVLLLAIIISASGIYAVKQTPVDALPDLSDVQVIVKTSYLGQSPQVVQDQITFPISSAMLAVPGAKTVRGYSFFGDSYVYIIFDEDTDIYWARSRVLEYLTQITPNLPSAAQAQLGPDASGVGWVYQYALVDKTGQHDLSELRSLQDWFLRYELQSVPGVAEVATIGGMVKQYQIQIDPIKLRAYQIPLAHVANAIKQANQETGASVIELAEAEYMLTTNGYIKHVEDIKSIPLGLTKLGNALTLADIANVSVGPQARRGIAELNGEGEVVGGIVVMRYGENAQQIITEVKHKIAELEPSLPKGVELVTVYDRSDLIQNAVDNLWQKLTEELVIVALVCLVFLFHLRSAIVAVISLPLGILISFLIMNIQGINANIMSLAGIAIAIGAMTDGAIVMIENMHKHMERAETDRQNVWPIVTKAATEVGPALFFSLLIITVSFLPVFILEAQEGKMFSPLAYTKTYAMAASAGLAITLIPVLMGYLIRGKIVSEHKNPINRLLVALYRPVLSQALKFPKLTLLSAFIVTLIGFYPANKIGSEFMPDLDEGDLMYMPSTYPSISIAQARQILQQTDKLIRTIPEVKTVFGKMGRAETATDPAPLTMIETVIQFKPKAQWRAGMTMEKLKQELNSLIQFPGLTNVWVRPIKTRIDMLSTGIKTPVGIKISGNQLAEIQKIGTEIEKILTELEGTASVYAERVAGGRYIKIDILRHNAARYGLNIADVQQIIATAIGGVNITQTIEGQSRFPVNMRYPDDYRNSPAKLAQLPIVTASGMQIKLSDIAAIKIEDGPPSIKSENARLNGLVLVDITASDLGLYVEQAKLLLKQQLNLPAGYSISWAGQYEYLERAKNKLILVAPITLLIIVILLYLSFRRFGEVLMILLTLPMATIGGIWLIYLYGYHYSVAVGVGFIALAGVAVEIGVIMLVYLNQALSRVKQQAKTENRVLQLEDYQQAILHGAGQRIRPVLMTVLTIILGLLPVLFSTGTGSEIMTRIAAPMVGGMLSAVLLTLIVLPVVFYLTVTRLKQAE